MSRSVICAITNCPGESNLDGNIPVLLHPIAGELPNRQVIDGSVAKKIGISAGHTYLMQFEETYPSIAWKRQFSWHVEKLITNPFSVFLSWQNIGMGKVFEVAGIDFHHCCQPDKFLEYIDYYVIKETKSYYRDIPQGNPWEWSYWNKWVEAAIAPETDDSRALKNKRKQEEIHLITSYSPPFLNYDAVLQDFALLQYWDSANKEYNKKNYPYKSWMDKKLPLLVDGILWRTQEYGKSWGMTDKELIEFPILMNRYFKVNRGFL